MLTRMSHGKLFVDFLKLTHCYLCPCGVVSRNYLSRLLSMISFLTMLLGPTLLLLCVDFLERVAVWFSNELVFEGKE